MLGKKVHSVSGQSLQQIAQRGWRYSMSHCGLMLKLKIAWRLATLRMEGWTTLPSEILDDLQESVTG